MENPNEIKEMVKEKYSQIAVQSSSKQSSCCGCGPETEDKSDSFAINDDYSKLEGYNPDADLNLGCGIPTQFAGINAGDVVVDLGSGAGNDVFVARSIVGPGGKVIGLDFTEEMIAKAEVNNKKLGFTNVEFKLGEIENIPLADDSSDVVVSNCVMNLVPDKKKAFTEVHRILKSGGHFCISDIVLLGEIPAGLKASAAMYAGCVSGALQQEDYINEIKNAGFEDVEIKKSKTIILPEDLIRKYLSDEEVEIFKTRDFGIKSITVVGYKK